jgi:hypothetical protein
MFTATRAAAKRAIPSIVPNICLVEPKACIMVDCSATFAAKYIALQQNRLQTPMLHRKWTSSDGPHPKTAGPTT